jgi:hypothetical protein
MNSKTKTGVSNTELLKNKALTVRLHRKKPNRNKMDKDLSLELQELKGVTDKSSLRVNKSLFPKEATKAYQDVITKGGKYFYRSTTPWDDKGWRLLSIDIYKSFTKELKKYARDFREAGLTFIDQVKTHIDAMRDQLGEAFNIEDYSQYLQSNGEVNVEWLKEQFVFEVEYGTVTGADDIRANLTDADREIIAEQITAQNEAKFAKSQQHVITRLHDRILKMYEALGDPDKGFHSTLVTNLEELVDLIPKLNIADDPDINELAAEAKLKLTKWDADTLKAVPSLRQEVADEADKMLKGMEGLI